MKINILYRVRGNVEENIFERVDDNSLEDELNMVNFTEIDEEEVTNIKDIMIDEEVKEIEIELDNDDTSLNNEESEEDMITEEVRKIDESTKQDILNSIKMEEDSYVTYHVHIVKEGETIESICKMYTINTSIINEYNNITEINVGDKILIPFDNE